MPNKTFQLDQELTEEQFVKRYMEMAEFGNSPEVEHYLKLRHRWLIDSTLENFQASSAAHRKTHLYKLFIK